MPPSARVADERVRVDSHRDASTQTSAESFTLTEFAGADPTHDNDDFIIVSELASAPPSQSSISSQPPCGSDSVSCASSTRGLPSTLASTALPQRTEPCSVRCAAFHEDECTSCGASQGAFIKTFQGFISENPLGEASVCASPEDATDLDKSTFEPWSIQAICENPVEIVCTELSSFISQKRDVIRLLPSRPCGCGLTIPAAGEFNGDILSSGRINSCPVASGSTGWAPQSKGGREVAFPAMDRSMPSSSRR
eukprot:2397513-Amphidinium_carterae.1